jgi:polyhydroxyalkanoate synthesis regulator phasin
MDTNNLLRQLLMIGVGTTSLVAERLKQVTEDWVREGKFNPDQAKGFVDEVMAQLNVNNAALEDQFQRLFGRASPSRNGRTAGTARPP